VEPEKTGRSTRDQKRILFVELGDILAVTGMMRNAGLKE
jgi:hypothetical protein